MKIIAILIIAIILLSSMSLVGASATLTTADCRNDTTADVQLSFTKVPDCWLVREVEGRFFAP